MYVVTLKFSGDFDRGFLVTLLINRESFAPELEINAELPPAPQITQQYSLWRAAYLGSNFPNRLEAKQVFISNYSYIEDCDRFSAQLLNSFNSWLDSKSFRPLKEKFLAKFHPGDEMRILIQTENMQLKILPWHLLDWFELYRKAEIALSNLNYETEIDRVKGDRHLVRILAIIGNSEGIDTECDRHILEQLPNCQITLLAEPTRQELTEQLWHSEGWDILFFAGHSNSDLHKKIGYINLNQHDSLTTKELKYALTKAREKGLKVALFNSCDGLGLAQELADLKIPQILVMREPVPDKVAQEFLKYFLAAYAGGESFYLAVKESRAKLQGIEDRYSCASWLPVIVQNPGAIPPTWQQLVKVQQTHKSLAPGKFKLVQALAASTIATIAVIGLRTIGILQTWELQAFDYLSQQLPPEESDRRILLIGANERDISADKYGFPVSDRVLAQLIDRLQQHQPAVIGVDIFRDSPILNNKLENKTELTNYWQQPNIVSICLGDNLDNSVSAPQASPQEQVGFVNIYDDSLITNGADDTVRRYLLSRSPNPLTNTAYCQTNYSFAWQLVYRYLQSKNIAVTTAQKNWQFGSRVVNRLTNRSGGYHTLDDRGNQLLISYRRAPQIAQQVSIEEILESQDTFDPQWIKNRIVIIGVVAKSVPDVHDTAVGKIRGLNLHAHVVSQLIAHVEDHRPLFWWLPQWIDWLWIGFWSSSCTVILVWKRDYLYRIVGIGSCILLLSGTCWLVLSFGGWLAWIPSLIAIALSTVGVWFLQDFNDKKPKS